MRGMFVLAILLSVAISIFALANNELTEINYLFGSTEVPKALLILLSLAFGVLIMFLFNIPAWWRNRREKSALKKQIQTLQNKLDQALLDVQSKAPEIKDDFIQDVDKE